MADPDVLKLARHLATLSPQQLRIAKVLLDRCQVDYAFAIRLRREREAFRSMFYGEDYEGLERWLAKRTLETVG